MCGIVGYKGSSDAMPILLKGLKSLEYRGYDSAGVAVVKSNVKIGRMRCQGKIASLQESLLKSPLTGNNAIGHTRWATHGRPCEKNAHPHLDCTGKIGVVHNGIIENYRKLKKELISKGHLFHSETDTEVVAHLIEENILKGRTLIEAAQNTVNKIEGSFALGIISSDHPDEMIAARKNSPLVIGLNHNEFYMASDVTALIPFTKEVVYLEDGDIVHANGNKVSFFDHRGNKVLRNKTIVNWDPVTIEKKGYKHFMLKEIHEQKQAIQKTLMDRISYETGEPYFEGFSLKKDYLKNINRILITACGTAYHAGLVGKFYIEKNAGIPCEVDIASEFRYRESPIDKDSMILAISQSGETADTLAAINEAKKRNIKSLVICNVPGSSATREADAALYTHAGPEIGVASTKAFTTQLSLLYLFSLYLAKIKKIMPQKEISHCTRELLRVPAQISNVIEKQKKKTEEISSKYYKKNNFLYLGRNVNYPIALEGALKLKEISYIHAEGYPAGEMKHGPIALIDAEMPVVVIAANSSVYDKIISNIEEVSARNGTVIALATEGNRDIEKYVSEVIYVPPISEALSAIVNTIPLQLIAYHIARLRGCDVDQPRNLAKSVTVE